MVSVAAASPATVSALVALEDSVRVVPEMSAAAETPPVAMTGSEKVLPPVIV